MSDLVNIPRKLFDATLAAAAVSVNIKTRDRAEFGKLDNIDGESLLATLVEMVTTLRAAARPGPGGCACLATVTAERDEAIESLRVIVACDDDNTLRDKWWTPHNYNPGEHITSDELSAAIATARAILSKHPQKVTP